MDAAGNTCDGVIGTPQLETRNPVSPLVHNLAVPANAQATSGRVRPAPFREQPVDSDVGPGGRPPIRSLDVFQNTAPITIAGVVTETRPVAKVRFTECSVYPCGSQVRSCMRRCGPWADGLDKSVRGIALRISCSHAGAMRRRPFLCARNRLAVVAVCNTTRYR